MDLIMSDKSLVHQLLEEALVSGRTPEEVCAAHPELVDEVRAQLKRVERVRDELNALFPSLSHTTGENTPLPRIYTDLPSIPGHEVNAVLGRGGMGIVYRARHIRLNRPVAVKMMLSGVFAGPQELARFRREAEALAELGHPHVVQIYEAGELDGLPYFTMELVEGGTLAEKLAGSPQSADRAATLAITLAKTVQAAHERGIVHRDLKPSNILLTPDDSPKISDFGLARRLEPGANLTWTGARVGTPSYMAPEQAAGAANAASPAVDVYALGAILYELLTGRPPFRAETAAETERQVIAEEPAPPSRLNAKVPRDLETICLKCLHKDPRRRYATAADLAADLGRFQRGEAIAARPVSKFERVRKWILRHKGQSVAGLSVIVLAVTLLVVGWWVLANRAATAREIEATARTVEEDLGVVEPALEAADWTQVRTAINRAKARLGNHSLPELQRRMERAERDLAFADRLRDIQTQYIESAGMGASNAPDSALADREYEVAFREAGFGTVGERPSEVAERIRATNIRRAIVEALDDWAACAQSSTGDQMRTAWILAVSFRADHDSGSGWRDQARNPLTWTNAAVTAELARTAPFDSQSVRLHLVLFGRIRAINGDHIAFLRRLQAANPNDFETTFLLGFELDTIRDPDAIGYYRAALAIRPKSLAALINLGSALDVHGRISEAADHWQAVVRLFPDNSIAHANLANSYHYLGQLDKAADEYRKAIQLNPKSIDAHAALGWTLFDQGQFDEAQKMAWRSLELMYPRHQIRLGNVSSVLAWILFTQAVTDEVRTASRMQRLERQMRGQHRVRADWTIERCERLQALESEFPAILQGTTKPTNAIPALDFADLCARRQHPGAAVGLYTFAFTATPGLSEEYLMHYRHDAARAAVRASLGEGQDAPSDDAKRVALRNQALDWLRANRDTWVARYDRGNAEDRRDTSREVHICLLDAILANVREPALARLGVDERRRWAAFWENLNRLGAGEFPTLGSAQLDAMKQKWESAAERYTVLAITRPSDLGQSWFEVAAAQLLAGDEKAFRQSCARLAARVPSTVGVRWYHIARTCTLAPDSGVDIAKVSQMSATELESKVNEAQFWSLTERGALLLRAGKSREAVPLFQQSLEADKRPGRQLLNWLWLSLAHQKLGQTDEARRWLDKASKWLDQFGGKMPKSPEAPGLELHNWLEAFVLRREAEALLRAPAGGK
jgi:tetratricopeptide (TPR) repeat protein